VGGLDPRLAKYDSELRELIGYYKLDDVVFLRDRVSFENLHSSKQKELTEIIFSPDRMLISIAIDKVNSPRALTKEVNKSIKEVWERIQNKKREYIKKEYQIFIQVGDMHNKGMKNEKIAEKLFPRSFRFDEDSDLNKQESAIRNVSHYLKSYKELVNGGYKNITYP